MQALRHQRDAAAGGDHHRDPVLPIAAINDLRLEAPLAAALEQQLAPLAMGAQEKTLAREIAQAHALLSREAMISRKDDDNTLAIEGVMPEPRPRRPRARHHRSIEAAVEQQV